MSRDEKYYADQLIVDNVGLELGVDEKLADKTVAADHSRPVKECRVTTYTVFVCGVEVSAHHDRADAESAKKAAKRTFIMALIHMGMERYDAVAEAEIEIGLAMK